jgi:ribosomal protein L21E
MDGTIVDYSWDFGDGSPAVNGAATPAHTYTSAGTYTVTLNVTDDAGALGTGTATVEVADTYILNTSSTDGGNVTTPDEGISTYNRGQMVNLMATPDSCYHFVNWTGNTINIADVNASSTTIVMNRSYSITANFAINTYTLTYNAGTGGSINGTTPQTVNCGANGSAVTAVPADCYHFVNWSDGILTAFRTDTDVTASTTVTANFAINTYTLNTSATNGNVIIPGQPGLFTYNCNQVVYIQATPANASCKFVNWTGNTGTIANVSTNSTTIIMNGNYSVKANFVVSGPTTTTYTFTTGGGVNKWCWQGCVHLLAWNIGHPFSPSDFANSYGYAAGGTSAYSAVSSPDSSSWRSNIYHGLGCCASDRNCELFKFKINESPASITNIQIKWKGHGTTGKRIYYTTEKLWKASNNTWNTLHNQKNVISDATWINNISSNCSNYIDSAGNLSVLVSAQRSGLTNNCGIWTDYVEVTVTHN